jgi:hypothetical protein
MNLYNLKHITLNTTAEIIAIHTHKFIFIKISIKLNQLD